MSHAFLDRLVERISSGMGPVVVGLDPRLEALPAEIEPGAPAATRILAFYRQVLPLLSTHVPAVKPNVAFFERHGAAGFAAYEETCELARGEGLLVIGDVKRGDIGSTAEAYADIHLRLADAVTLQPYLGSDALRPFLDRCRADGKAVFVLVRTSNPSAGELQDLRCGEERLCEVVARLVNQLTEGQPIVSGYSPVGAVVGATAADDVGALRERMPHAWMLLPGVGAQGAHSADCAAAFDRDGLGGLISQSRGIMQCFSPDDPSWFGAIEAACSEFSRQASEVAHGGAGSRRP